MQQFDLGNNNFSNFLLKVNAFDASLLFDIFSPFKTFKALINPTVKHELEPIPLLAGKSPS